MAGITRPASFGPHSGAPYGDFEGRVQADRTIGVVTQPYAFGAFAGRAYTFAPTVQFDLEVVDPIALTGTAAVAADPEYSESGEFSLTPPLDVPSLSATLSVAASFTFTTGPEVPRDVGPLTQALAFGPHSMRQYEYGRFDFEVLDPIALAATLGASASGLAAEDEEVFAAAGRKSRVRKQTATKVGVGSIQFNRMAAASMLAEQERAAVVRDDQDVQEVLLALGASRRIM